jgi:hypothetical protein
MQVEVTTPSLGGSQLRLADIWAGWFISVTGTLNRQADYCLRLACFITSFSVCTVCHLQWMVTLSEEKIGWSRVILHLVQGREEV